MVTKGVMFDSAIKKSIENDVELSAGFAVYENTTTRTRGPPSRWMASPTVVSSSVRE